MSSTDDRDELRDLRDLARDAPPPPAVEDRVVAALRQRDLIRSEGSDRRAGWGSRMAIAASLLVAVLGGWIGRGLVEAAPGPGTAAADAQKEYLLVLSEPNGLETTKSMPELVGEYSAWAQSLAADGRMVAARRLESGSRGLSLAATGDLQVSTAIDPSSATGFFLIRADSMEEALSLVEDCPHLAYGGEVRVSEVARDS